MSVQYDFDAPDRFSVAAPGPPGERVFVIQAAQGRQVLTLKLEKQQVAALAEYLGGVVRQAPRPGHVEDAPPIEGDAEPDWVVGTIGVSFDAEADRVVLVIEELVPEDESGSMARLSVTREQAAAFAIAATRLVASGRPPCPLCGAPLDPSGHLCPRTNGHRPPSS